QTDSIPSMSKNTVYVEGSTLIFINLVYVNYERKFFSSPSEKLHLYGRAGFAYINFEGILSPSSDSTGGLLGATLLTGKKNHHFEGQAAIFLGNRRKYHSSRTEEYFQAIPLLDVGYRYQKPKGGFIFKAKLGISGVGIGLGYAF
ncbi:MAG: hypothetical protein ACPGU0_08825, partial [Marinirhabdus sp.]